MDNTNKESDGGNCREHLSKEENWAQSLRSLKKGLRRSSVAKVKENPMGIIRWTREGAMSNGQQ